MSVYDSGRPVRRQCDVLVRTSNARSQTTQSSMDTWLSGSSTRRVRPRLGGAPGAGDRAMVTVLQETHLLAYILSYLTCGRERMKLITVSRCFRDAILDPACWTRGLTASCDEERQSALRALAMLGKAWDREPSPLSWEVPPPLLGHFPSPEHGARAHSYAGSSIAHRLLHIQGAGGLGATLVSALEAALANGSSGTQRSVLVASASLCATPQLRAHLSRQLATVVSGGMAAASEPVVAALARLVQAVVERWGAPPRGGVSIREASLTELVEEMVIMDAPAEEQARWEWERRLARGLQDHGVPAGLVARCFVRGAKLALTEVADALHDHQLGAGLTLPQVAQALRGCARGGAGARGDPPAVARALYSLDVDDYQVARVLCCPEGAGYTVEQVARALYAQHGARLAAPKVARLLWDSRGVGMADPARVATVLRVALPDMSLRQMAWVLYSGDGLDLDLVDVVRVLTRACGAPLVEVVRALRRPTAGHCMVSVAGALRRGAGATPEEVVQALCFMGAEEDAHIDASDVGRALCSAHGAALTEAQAARALVHGAGLKAHTVARALCSQKGAGLQVDAAARAMTCKREGAGLGARSVALGLREYLENDPRVRMSSATVAAALARALSSKGGDGAGFPPAVVAYAITMDLGGDATGAAGRLNLVDVAYALTAESGARLTPMRATRSLYSVLSCGHHERPAVDASGGLAAGMENADSTKHFERKEMVAGCGFMVLRHGMANHLAHALVHGAMLNADTAMHVLCCGAGAGLEPHVAARALYFGGGLSLEGVARGLHSGMGAGLDCAAVFRAMHEGIMLASCHTGPLCVCSRSPMPPRIQCLIRAMCSANGADMEHSLVEDILRNCESCTDGTFST
ncbi:hypothetical protein CYMTET_24798 [Cymbomonas tetramitiformis]|uniref:F-box domain-containing protein n=1 Tax=Cymbomonas tetramitiformis TaxID=36881 RepID=A0AAE0FV58_9CHLO|nr:hypothetical protein CYMTET_24798 [Cymbomonas tetramitiformis]